MEEKFGILTKKYMVSELVDHLSKDHNFVVANYKGTGSIDIEKLRKEMRKLSAGYVVVKNSILKRAFKELGIKNVDSYIKGEVGLGFMGSDPVAAAKALVDFSKTNEAFQLRCAYLDGKLEGSDKVKQLASLPPREVLLAMVLTRMKGPITGFVGVLGGLLRNFVYAIKEIKDKREKEGGDKK